MDVKLLAYTPEPVRVLWTAARTCYSPLPPQELWHYCPGPERAVELLRSLWKRGHHSVFEHVSFTYAVSDVSRVLLAQYSRHRIGVSLSVQSQRHVEYEGGMVWPDSIVPGGNIHKPATEEVAFEAYITCRKAYNRLVALGVPPEDARFVLPQGVVTSFVTAVNLRSLMHLCRLRVLEPGAQWEIKRLVQEMVRLATRAVPELAAIIPEVKGGETKADEAVAPQEL